jgi:hypothetical protein
MDAIAAWLTSNGGSVGFAGLVSLAIWLILTGRLVPRASVDALRADWNARLDAKEVQVQDWKQSYFRSLDTVAVQGKQIDELLEHSRTTAYFIQALANRTEKAP